VEAGRGVLEARAQELARRIDQMASLVDERLEGVFRGTRA
jgi:hypothetical protein